MTARLYELEISKVAERDLARLPKATKARVAEKIRSLVEDPRPEGVKALQGRLAGAWRIRAGDQRVLYEIRDDLKRVLILRIRNRREAYR